MAAITVHCSAISPILPPSCNSKGVLRGKQQFTSSFTSNDSSRRRGSIGGFEARACLFNPNQQPILKEALKEPVAFVGGIFAGLLRLDLNEEPLKEWVVRTVEASGITEEIGTGEAVEEMPQQIEIE